MGFAIESIIGIRLHMYNWTILVSFDPTGAWRGGTDKWGDCIGR